MTVNGILSSVSASLAQQSTPVSVRQAASVNTIAEPASTTHEASSYAPSNLILQSANLIGASSSFSQLNSLLQVAQNGTQQVGSILQQLQSLAEQASQSPAVTGLDSDFEQLLSQLQQTTSNTTFGNSNLLNGTFSGSNNATSTSAASTQNTPSLSLPDLTISGLFGGNTPSIDTAQNAQSAVSVLASAQNLTSDASSQISAVLGQLNFAAASVNSVLFNNDAASSTLSESDFGDGTASDTLSGFLSNSAATAQTQTANLPSSLLGLLQE